MNATLGIDIGTYESKGVLVDSDGHVLASAARPHELIAPRAGWAEHRPEQDWWDDFVWLCQKLLADSRLDASKVKAVGASAIGPCMLPVDADGMPLMNAVLYGVDTRAACEIEDLTAGIGANRILSHGGNALTSQAVGPKILWLKRNRPEIYAKARMFLNSTSFLVHRLTGRFVTDHYSASSVAPLYDIESRTWSDRLTHDITDLECLPEIAWTTEIAGGVTRRAAEETGLAFGTPVIAGTIDAAAEAISVGVLDPVEMMLMYGSTIFTIRIGDERIRDPRLWHAPWLFPGQFACMAGLATSGTLTHWFADQLARDLSPDAAMTALAAEGETSPPGAKGLVFLPYFSGERTPIHDPNAKGAIIGLTLAHTRARHLPSRVSRASPSRPSTSSTLTSRLARRLLRSSPLAGDFEIGSGHKPRPMSRGSDRRCERSASAPRTVTPFWPDLRSATSPSQRSSSGIRRHSQLSLIPATRAFTKDATWRFVSFIRVSAI